MPTIFERIATGEIPCHKVWEDERHLAFLDINPVVDGHTLVIPKQALADELFDLSPADFRALMDASRTVAAMLKAKLDCKRVVMAVYGFEVPHSHVHLLPASDIGDVAFPDRDPGAKERLMQFAKRLAPA
ncbi:MAG: HIT family protein [Planctomycetaceae bacterium]|nr:HIT family protein [Planctomycetaceae bacterium]